MTIKNLKGNTARPFSKTPERDYSSLAALTRRRRTKGTATNKCTTSNEQRKEYTRKQVTKTKERLNMGADIQEPNFKPGDVVGSLKVVSITEDNHLDCVCTCGRPVLKTEATIKSIDVCRHTTQGVFSQEFKSRQYYRGLFKSWVKMCENAAAKNRSIYKPWQHFKEFVKDNHDMHKSGLTLYRVIPDSIDPVESPKVYAWITVGNARTIHAFGLPIADTHRGDVSLFALALKHKVRLCHITKPLNEGATPESVYTWLINLIEKRNRKQQNEQL
ncbi:coil containing protein [Vibrio phage 1.215.B._10N.222.54.F7]|nr:coil containing protein [Vibrio phage 1.215.A._10N.222.54.F7]AUR96051.1 coil containing protein [Vibrio phage 1.215.B._10N.222.54.F7]